MSLNILLQPTEFFSVLVVLSFLLLFPASGLAENLVPNPGFENISENGEDIPGWEFIVSGSSNQDVSVSTIDGEEVFAGRYSVAITDERQNARSELRTTIDTIKPDTWYHVSLQARRDRESGWFPYISVLNQIRTAQLRKANVWERFDWLIFSGGIEGQTLLRLIHSRKPFKVYFDAIDFQEFQVRTGQVNEEDRIFHWEVPQTDSILNYKVEWSRDSNFSRRIGSLEHILDNFCQYPYEFDRGFWRVTAYKNRIKLAVSKPTAFKIPKKLSYSTGDPERAKLHPRDELSFDSGYSTSKNQRLFPVGLFTRPGDNFTAIADAGFNTVFAHTGDAGDASAKGFKVITPFSKDIACDPPENLLAWYLWDEPGQYNVPAAQVWEKQKHVQSISPDIPTVLVEYLPENYWTYGLLSDIFAVDPYPVPHRPLSLVSSSLEKAKDVCGKNWPLWCVIQAFDWQDADQEAQGIGRLPTRAEMDCMSHLAIVHGAKGILFYKSKKWDELPLDFQESLIQVAQTLVEDIGIFILEDAERQPVALLENGRTTPSIHLLLKEKKERTWLWFKKSSLYLIMVNSDERTAEATIENLSGNISSMKIVLEPYETMVLGLEN